MTPYYEDDLVALHTGDCLNVIRQLNDASVDAVVTDPPYGLGFMGKQWDALPPGEDWARECLRVLKPGGHLLAFGGSRTWHRLAVAIEDGGFEIRDSIAWLYGSGFPKSLDVSKEIDRAAGAERTEGAREWSGGQRRAGVMGENLGTQTLTKFDVAATAEAAQWQGWGTALKPAFEPIVVGRKALDGTVASNVLRLGTGALNIDGCRVGDEGGTKAVNPTLKNDGTGRRIRWDEGSTGARNEIATLDGKGRWPANVVLDETQAAALDEQSGVLTSGLARTGERAAARGGEIYGKDSGFVRSGDTYGDTGGASRFFYVAKAGADERPRVDGVAHPTVKPLDLMRWLVRLVTPPGGTVLEPFAGSGTTAEACLLEGFRCIAIEREADYLPLIEARLARRRDPVRAIELAGEDGGLFDLIDKEGVA